MMVLITSHFLLSSMEISKVCGSGQISQLGLKSCGLWKLWALVMPKFHYTDFYRNFLMGKVVDTNRESRGHKW